MSLMQCQNLEVVDQVGVDVGLIVIIIWYVVVGQVNVVYVGCMQVVDDGIGRSVFGQVIFGIQVDLYYVVIVGVNKFGMGVLQVVD